MKTTETCTKYLFNLIAIAKVQEVDIDRIVELEDVRLTGRTHLDSAGKAQSEALTESTRNLALHTPVLLLAGHAEDPDQLAQVDGKKRINTARLNGATTILAKTIDKDAVMANPPFAELPLDDRWPMLRQGLLAYHISCHLYTSSHSLEEIRSLFEAVMQNGITTPKRLLAEVRRLLGIDVGGGRYRDIKRTIELLQVPAAVETVNKNYLALGMMKVERNRDVFTKPERAHFVMGRLEEYDKELRKAASSDDRHVPTYKLKGWSSHHVRAIFDEALNLSTSTLVAELEAAKDPDFKISYVDSVVTVPAFKLDFADSSRNAVAKLLEFALQFEHLFQHTRAHLQALAPDRPGGEVRHFASQPTAIERDADYLDMVKTGHWERYANIRRIDQFLRSTRGDALVDEETRKLYRNVDLRLLLVQALADRNSAEAADGAAAARTETSETNELSLRRRSDFLALSIRSTPDDESEAPDGDMSGSTTAKDAQVEVYDEDDSEYLSSIKRCIVIQATEPPQDHENEDAAVDKALNIRPSATVETLKEDGGNE